MPLDIFAALGALVRAEARRTTPKPRTADSPAEKTAAQSPSSPEPPPPTESPDPAPDLGAEPPGRRGLRAWLLRGLTALTAFVHRHGRERDRTDSTNSRRKPRS